ncbi:MAG: extracellular solute-binding protein [Clostridia bacterium]|nr:extracellular solute-binding protein [Clostridia bacterium]
MKRKARRLLAMLLCVIMLVSTMIIPLSAAGKKGSGSIADVSDILNALTYAEYRKSYLTAPKGEDTVDIIASDDKNLVKEDTTADIKVVDWQGKENVLYIPSSGSVTWKFNIENAGNYVIAIEYCQADDDKTNSVERIFYINGEVPFSEARSIVLSKIWEYKYKVDENGNKTFETDTNGNDIRPEVIPSLGWTEYEMIDSNGYYTNPFEFYFDGGENTITFESVREPVYISKITLRPQKDIATYDEYLKQHGASSAVTSSPIKIEAEAPNKVSNVTMYPVNDRTSSITTGLTGNQSAQVTKYNTAGKEQWQTVGEWMTYEIEVAEDGYYSIVLRYKQDLLSGMYVSRRVYIDGEIPFAEASNCRFPFTNDWKTVRLGDGETEFKFYLTKGKHEIKLEAVLGEMSSIIQQVNSTLSNINSCYLEILKLTGSDPDENRTYNFSRVMPDVLKTMMIESVNLKEVYDYLVEQVGKGEKTATIEQIYILLNKMASDEEQIPGNLATLKTQIGSLGTWINSAQTQPLQVDYIQVQGAEMEVPKAEAGFFASLWYQIKLFYYSFTTDYNSLGATSDEAKENAVEVWVTTGTNAGREEAQIIRNLADNSFTPKKNISVNLKLVSGGTLLPSVLAGVGPDVSLMEGSTTIIDYALRNAVVPLNTFIEEDLKNGEDVLSAFPDAAVVPLTLYNYDVETDTTTQTYYALPDTLNFSMMFYRKDVLSSLDLEIPRTWDDLLSILPVLQYNNMEIGIQNDIYTFIYQSGYEAYADEGMRINFDDPGVLNAFTKLCNMYTQYSLPYTYDFANRFRTGEMPIGIAGYTTCNQLSIFASELSGLWSFVPLPGYELKDENGETYINNCAMATVTGSVMLAGSKNQKGAWEFMKWYTSADFQIPYSNDIVSIKGIAARPATANTEALAELPWTSEEAENILAQFENLAAVENHPGSYYLARYVNFAFLAAYNEGKDPADALMDYVNTINKEIIRKRQEFGMDVLEIGQTLADLKANPALKD